MVEVLQAYSRITFQFVLYIYMFGFLINTYMIQAEWVQLGHNRICQVQFGCEVDICQGSGDCNLAL